MALVSTSSTHGVVTDFDDDRGIGVVAVADGRTFGFHCTAIDDGSRTIEVGTAVSFDVIAGRSGRWEAWGITR